MINYKSLKSGDIVVFAGVWKNLPPVMSIFLDFDEQDWPKNDDFAQIIVLTIDPGDIVRVSSHHLYLVQKVLK